MNTPLCPSALGHGPVIADDPELMGRLATMLSDSSWATSLEGPDIERLGHYLTTCSAPAGRTLFIENDPGEFMAVILEGTVEISKADTKNGVSQKTLTRMGAGRAFGELSLVDGDPRSATATVIEPTVLAVLTTEAFERMIGKDKSLALKLLRNIARLMSFRLRQTSHRLVEYL